VIVQMQTVCATPETYLGPISIRAPDPPRVLVEVMHVDRDDRSTTKADSTGIDQTRLR